MSHPQGTGGGFNLSEWALNHRAFTRYLMVVLLLLGVAASRVVNRLSVLYYYTTPSALSILQKTRGS